MWNLTRSVAAFAFVLLVACDSGSGGSPGTSPTTMSEAQVASIGQQVARCFRENGVPTFPDPIVTDGRLELPEGVEAEIERQYPQQVLEQAQKACQGLMDQLPESAIRGEDQDRDEDLPSAGDVDALRRLAACVRANGIPEFPDPKADGSFPVRGTPLEAEGKSQRFGDAFEKCQQHWHGSITYS